MINSDWFVYLLLCDQKTFYVGITDKVEERLGKHQNKQSFFTKKFSDIKLVYCEKHPNKYIAAKREKQIKGWSRKKKEALIAGNFELLVELSNKKLK